MKTIYQLRKIANRIPRIARHATSRLMKKGNALTDGQRRFWQAKLAGCYQATQLLKQEVEARRINAPAFRCALPLKKQRAIIAANDSATAQKLLQGSRLAAA